MEPVKRTSYQMLTAGMHRDEALSFLRGEAELTAVEAGQGRSRAVLSDAKAQAALDQLTDLFSDNILTPSEKPRIIQEWTALNNEYSSIVTQAYAAGVDPSVVTAYGTALGSMANYLANACNLPTLWSDLSGNTDLTTHGGGALMRTYFLNAYKTRQDVLNATAAKINATAITANGAIGGANLLRNSSFESSETTTIGHGVVPAGWAEYNNGGEACTYSIVTVNGSRVAKVVWTTANSSTRGWYTNSGYSVGGKTAGIIGGWKQNQWYTVSFDAWAAGDAVGKSMSLQWNSAPNDTLLVNKPSLSGSSQRYVFKIRWTSYTPRPEAELFITIDSVCNSATLYLDNVMVQEGERATAYAPAVQEAFDMALTAQAGTLNIQSTQIAPGAIGTPQLAANAVTTNILNVADINSTGKLTVPAANITGKLTASQIEAVSLSTDAITIGSRTWRQRFYRWSVTFNSSSLNPVLWTYSGTDVGYQPDDDYALLATPESYTGSPPAGAFTVKKLSRSPAGWSLELLATPGSGSSVTWTVVFMRLS